MSSKKTNRSSESDMEFIARQLRKPSGDFAETIAEKMNQGNKPLFDLTLETMIPSDGERILEIGFANGKFFKELHNCASQLKIYGIDLSEEMVKSAARENKELIRDRKLKLIQGSSDALPFEDQFFDKVFCNMVIYFWEYPAAHLSEIERILKPGGSFYTGFRPKESMLQFPFVRFGFTLYEIDEWSDILRGSGFDVTDVAKRSDPVFKDGEERVRLQSVCIKAMKVGAAGFEPRKHRLRNRNEG